VAPAPSLDKRGIGATTSRRVGEADDDTVMWNRRIHRRAAAAAGVVVVSGAGATLAHAATQPPAPEGHSAGAAVMSAPPQFSRSTQAAFRFVVGAGNRVACTLDGRTVPCSSSSAALTNLAQGRHTFIVTATDSVGDVATGSSTWVADTARPSAGITRPGRPTALSRRIVVAWSGRDGAGSGVASYDVRLAQASWNGRLSRPVVWKRGLSTTSAALTGSTGTEYCFSVRARDRAGNVSGWSRRTCTTLPLDDRALRASPGWQRTLGDRYYGGTISAAARQGRTLIRTSAPRGRAALVVTRGPGFGTLSVRYNGRTVKTISLSAASRRDRVVVALPALTAAKTTIVIRTTSGRRVLVDGLMLARV